MAAWAAWLATGVVTAVCVVAAVARLATAEVDPGQSLAAEAIWDVLPAFFAFSGAFIVSRQPRNTVGWLLLGPALGMTAAALVDAHLQSLDSAPTDFSILLALGIVLVELSWMLLIFPLFHLLQVFPTGRVLSPRWRWLAWLELGMIALVLLLVIFSREIKLTDGSWAMDNPFGFVPPDFFDGLFMPLWTLGLFVLAVGGGASSIIRFRRSSAAVRRQIKLVLYAFTLMAVVYAALAIPWTLGEAEPSGSWAFQIIVDILLLVSVTGIPVVIAIAVLRHGLFDIDVIVRRTLIYAVLTGLLSAVYFGSVMLLRGLIGDATGTTSSVTVAASTLLVAALFTPLRRRVQSIIDRRLYRRRYDAEKVVASFTRSLRHQGDLTALREGLLAAADNAVQPRSAGLWIRVG